MSCSAAQERSGAMVNPGSRDGVTGDLLDLPRQVRNTAMDEAAIAARFLKTEFAVSKINFAAIGNVVSQLHLHVVGRRATDPCWPAPIWGNLVEADGYSCRADCHSYRNVDSKSFAKAFLERSGAKSDQGRTHGAPAGV